MIGATQQKLQIALYTCSIVLATLGLVCRLWARRVTGTRWQVNDYLMILAYFHVLGLVITSNLAVTLGEMGVHTWEIPKHRLQDVITFSLKTEKMTIAMPFFMISASFFVKMSITHFYIILFPHTWLQKLCKAQFFLLTLCWLAGIVPCFVGCRPFAYTWDRSIPGGECFDMKNFWFGTSIVAMFFDLTCVALPIPVFWSLKMETGKKVKLTLVFGLGFFICGLSAARIYKHKQILFTDLTYTAAPAMMLTVPEPSLGIVAGCLPICVPLFAKFARASSAIKSSLPPSWRSRSSSSGSPPETSRYACTTENKTKAKMGFSWRSRGRSRSKSKSKSRGDLDTEALAEPEEISGSYPMTSVVVSRASREDDYLPGMCPEQLRATEEMMRFNGGIWNGITVLREVHVEREARWSAV